MSLTITLPASQARTNFYSLLDDVTENLKKFIITRKGKAQAVVVPLEEAESWEETMEILSNKKLVKDIRQGLNDIQKGNFISEKQLMEKANIK